MSYSYNHIVLVGRVCHDPDFFESDSYSRLRFKLAINRYYKEKEVKKLTDYLPIVFWSKLAVVAKDHLKKGTPVLIEGRLRASRYEKNGEIKYAVEVHGTGFQKLSSVDKHHKGLELSTLQRLKAMKDEGIWTQDHSDVFIEFAGIDLNEVDWDQLEKNPIKVKTEMDSTNPE